MNKKTKKTALSAVTFLLCILLLCEKVTGTVIHAVLGLALVTAIVIHTAVSLKNFQYAAKKNKAEDVILICTVIFMIVTGILLHPLGHIFILKLLHKLSGAAFVAECIIHLLLHRQKERR